MVVLHWRLALCYGMGKLCGVLIPLDLEEMRKAGILTPSHGRGESPPPPRHGRITSFDRYALNVVKDSPFALSVGWWDVLLHTRIVSTQTIFKSLQDNQAAFGPSLLPRKPQNFLFKSCGSCRIKSSINGSTSEDMSLDAGHRRTSLRLPSLLDHAKIVPILRRLSSPKRFSSLISSTVASTRPRCSFMSAASL